MNVKNLIDYLKIFDPEFEVKISMSGLGDQNVGIAMACIINDEYVTLIGDKPKIKGQSGKVIVNDDMGRGNVPPKW